ncbi:MAG: SUF system NifU family Fe-S cluster assembly protein [Candidatus Bipolaricaulota bacterium]|nr:SUF system NifU family Fe-S cluster assembly protein [Candidatus Bipolaricaulota bacterium]MCS7275372.1 SUF system NifU family Fe-S cluster assembly protein [Candidatus Bipolaricaulota bacterium]MDW8110129.1 SUF system NifU family Fe-S cluster assembly protein [Candidatus Bipolaricaulota bacterium]MDW8328951.1 SUF system NifU family Fe-S cluster assembly protein [Candidatus Bipolaricaulota bacterium]
MDRQAYIELLLDHYEHPRNRGRLENPDVQMSWGNPGCGDVVTLYLKISADGRITEIAFEGEGCTVSQASASILTEHVKGQTLSYAQNLSPDDVAAWVGREVMMSRPRCALLALSALKLALQEYRASSPTASG